MIDRFKDLTDKQKQFCKEYVTDWNATRSAKAAGYSEDSAQQIGSENLLKPLISDYIEHIQEDLLKLCGISVLSNVNVLKDILENKESREADRIKALEVINKMLGLNAPEKTENKNTNTEIPISNWVKGTTEGSKDMDSFDPNSEEV